MAERYYTAASGNWSTTANWDGGVSLPGAGDDVYANGKAITVDISPTVLSIRTTAGATAVAGGSCSLSNGVTLTCTGAGAVSGSSTVLAYSGSGTANFVGNITGSGTTNSTWGATHSGTGNLNVTGNVTGGANAGSGGILFTSSGTLAITGSVQGGPTNGNSQGVRNNSSGTLTISGNATAGAAATCYGAWAAFSGTVTVSGAAIGNNFGFGGSGGLAYGAYCDSSSALLTVGTIQDGPKGAAGAAGAYVVASLTAATHKVYNAAGSSATLGASSGGGRRNMRGGFIN